jgi:hypothetical protein
MHVRALRPYLPLIIALPPLVGGLIAAAIKDGQAQRQAERDLAAWLTSRSTSSA